MAKVTTAIPPNLDVDEGLTPVINPEEFVVKGVYATEYFKRNGMPYCEKCGEQYHTDTNNNPVCAENFPANICPRLGN